MIANYRPVSNLSFVSKLIERVVAAQLLDHLSVNNILSDHQSAYRLNYSTETALLCILEDLLSAADSGDGSALLLLDLSAAFDTIDHAILIERLSLHCGVSEIALKWFSSYLADRSQSVVVNGVCSEGASLTSGVPQGSVLGPLLYLTYVNPLASVVENVGAGLAVKMSQFSDDTQLRTRFKLLPSPSQQGQALDLLSDCASRTEAWFTSNRVKLNVGKSELLYASAPNRSKLISSLPLIMGDGVVSPSSSVKNLGVTLDSGLTMVQHINNLCKSAFFQIRSLGKIRRFLTRRTARILVQSLVLSRLDYANSLLAGLPSCLILKLQRVQNAAARLVVGAKKFESVAHHLKSLRWLPIKERIDLKVLVLAFRCLHGFAPPYLSSLIQRYNPARALRSSNAGDLAVPPGRAGNLGSRAFSRMCPTLWNSLPEKIKTSVELKNFKSLLKAYLFGRC